MMQTLKLIKSQCCYNKSLAYTEKLWTLAEFLLDCGGRNVEDVKTTIKNYGDYNANATLADLQGNTIVISHWYAGSPDFIIQYDTFLKFLDEWKIVYAARPSEIIVTMDDQHQHFTIEAIP